LFRSGSPGGTRSTQIAKPQTRAYNKGAQQLKIAIAGGHGQIALRLTGLLAARGDDVVALIRNPDHASDVRQAGASAAVCDLEQASVEEVAAAIEGCNAVVFAAGAGHGSGAQRKVTMDKDGAIKLLRAATLSSVGRYVMVSGAGVEDPPSGDEVFEVYLRAKAAADAAVEESDLDWTILRPGGLTDDAGTGKVRIEMTPFRDPVPRDDVAAVLAALLADGRSRGRILYLSSGSTPIGDALYELLV
jgi:nucleoside-diphosphate-sugar epimerase